MNFAQNEPRGCKITKIWPIWAKRTPKWSQRVPKGRQKWPQNQQKYHKKSLPRKRLKKGVRTNIILTHFWPIFGKKMRPKIDAKNDAKKSFKKSWKWSKKQGTIPSQEMHFLIDCLQRRFLQNSVFTKKNRVFWRSRVLKVCIQLKNIRGESKQKHSSNKDAKNM